MTDNLDDLLSQPLPPVADNGFSRQVMARIRKEEQRRFVVVGIIAAILATVVCLLVPWSQVLPHVDMAPMLHSLNHFETSLAAVGTPLSFAAGVLLLIYLYDRKLLQI